MKNFTNTTLTIFLTAVLFTISASAETFIVINNNFGGAGSFADALARANAAPSDDVITFAEPVFDKYYTSDADYKGLTVADNGSLTIQGGGSDRMILSAYYNRNPSSALIIGQGAQVIINDVSITSTRANLGVLENASLTLNNSVISDGYNINGIGGRLIGGGAIAAYEDSRVEINNSTIKDNYSTSGGGVYSNYGELIINNSVIKNNQGGGVYSARGATIRNSVISGNTSGAGLRIFNFAQISGCLITDNDNGGRYGGGIFAGWLDISNTTISGNVAAFGGGIWITPAAATLARMTNVMITDNFAGVGGGIGHSTYDNQRLFYMGNTIVAGNTASQAGPDISGKVQSLGYNIIQNTSGLNLLGNTTHDIQNTDPLLGTLADNGGFTKTHSLLPGSPAINAGNNALAVDADNNPLQFDQRGAGFPRIVGGTVDIGAFELQNPGNAFTKVKFDFDGDRKADKVVFRPENGTWYELLTSGGTSAVAFGTSTDKIVPADYDGDGKTDIAVFRDGFWYILNSSNNGFSAVQFGLSSDLPVPADYDGDGRADVAVFRDGYWYILKSSDSGFRAEHFGQAGDIPTLGDFDADGKSDLAVYRNRAWYIQQSQNGFRAEFFGQFGDIPVAADYDGDGRTDVAVYREGFWYILNSTTGFSAVQFGNATDEPVPADYDGDGKTDVAVYRGGFWYLLGTTSGFNAVQYGAPNDLPAPNAFIRQ